MQISEWQIALVKLIAARAAATPEKYTGGLEINSIDGEVGDIKLHITYRPEKRKALMVR